MTNFFDPFNDYHDKGWQPAHGLYALSTGGLFGQGIGASQQKWGDLPEAHTDFIFAVLGEELGLAGTLLVITLFLTIAFAALRVARRTEDPFVRYASFGIVVWLVGQMIINVGMVLALLPGHRHPAAADLLRRLRAAAVAGGPRSAGRLRAPRAGGRPRAGPATQAALRRAVGRPLPLIARGHSYVSQLMRILLAGGGTAGHTSPLLATADALRRLEPAAEITCLGTARGLETRVVPEAGYPLELIAPVPLPRRPSVDLLRVPGRLRGAVKEARAVLERVRPDVVVGYGGYVSVPAYLAARRAEVPIVVHEQNSLPGLANRVGARIATRVAVSFPDTPLRHAEYVGLPIRTMISGLDRMALRAEARAFFGLDPDLPDAGRHRRLAGRAHRQHGDLRRRPRAGRRRGAGAARGRPQERLVPQDGVPTYVPVGYVDRMDYALAAADLMVCRAGASSVTEAAAVGVPAIFVPLPIGNGEQPLNARPVVEAGGALLVADAAFTRPG